MPSLVRAFDAVASSRPGVRLVIAGPAGWGEDALSAAIASARHRAAIDRLGWVSRRPARRPARRRIGARLPVARRGLRAPAPGGDGRGRPGRGHARPAPFPRWSATPPCWCPSVTPTPWPRRWAGCSTTPTSGPGWSRRAPGGPPGSPGSGAPTVWPTCTATRPRRAGPVSRGAPRPAVTTASKRGDQRTGRARRSRGRARRRATLDGPAGSRSTTAAASATGSPGGTSRPAAGPAGPRISGGPPASVATTGTPLASASTTTRPNGSGWVDASTNTSRSAISSATSERGPIQCTPAMARGPGGQVPGVALLVPDLGPGHQHLGARTGGAHRRHRVEQDAESLPRVDPADGADQRGAVRDADTAPEGARPAGGEPVGVGLVGHHLDVARVELGRHRGRDGHHRGGEAPGQPPLEPEHRGRLVHDLPGVPHVGAADQGGDRPAVPASAASCCGSRRPPSPGPGGPTARRSPARRGGSGPRPCGRRSSSAGAWGRRAVSPRPPRTLRPAATGRARRCDRSTRRRPGCAPSAGGPDPSRRAPRWVGW